MVQVSLMRNKQDIIDKIKLKEIDDELSNYSEYFEYWYDGGGYYYDTGQDYEWIYFYDWLDDPSRLRDEKIEKIIGISPNSISENIRK
jgi:hypothetical protein